jgi:hypothetical protein
MITTNYSRRFHPACTNNPTVTNYSCRIISGARRDITGCSAHDA